MELTRECLAIEHHLRQALLLFNGRLLEKKEISYSKWALLRGLLKEGTLHYLSVNRTLRYRWFAALHYYFRTKLTFRNKDIIRAIQGIGCEIQKQTCGSFAHGILSQTLLPSPLWHEKAKFEDNELSCQPSWHWPSLGAMSYLPVCRIYGDDARDVISLPLAYPFMSDDCTPLATMDSKDFWPKLLVIGRLLVHSSLHWPQPSR